MKMLTVQFNIGTHSVVYMFSFVIRKINLRSTEVFPSEKRRTAYALDTRKTYACQGVEA